MIDFDIVDGKVKVDANSLTVAAFNDIWEYDTGKNVKTKATKMLTYVFHMCDLREKNPFRDVAYDQKESACKKDSFGDKLHKFKPKEQELIDNAISWYEFLNKGSIQRLGEAMDRKIDQVVMFMNDSKNDILTEKQLDSQTDTLYKIDKILIAKKKTDDFIRNELTKTKIKAGTSASPLSSGLLDD